MPRIFRVATRKSKMAMVQTKRCIALMEAAAPDAKFEILPISSDGCYEKFQGDLSTIGGKGVFIKALEKAMLSGDADIAMHSLKDVPTDKDLPTGLIIPCVLKREDVRDAVVCQKGQSFASLKPNSKVGTSSVRRASQLKNSMPHLKIVPLRGNADTRTAKVDAGEVDAAILAASGLRRIGLEHRITDIFEPDLMLPAVGQGTVAMECRIDDNEAIEMLNKVNHADTFTRITAERTMLTELGGNCHTPIAGLCTFVDDNTLNLVGLVSSLDGTKILRVTENGPSSSPAELGQKVAAKLLQQGAKAILDSCEKTT